MATQHAQQINEEIRDREVRLIGADGAQLGIVNGREAMQKAWDLDLDLVKISPNAVPPVCKIMDYGKFRFEQSKREKEAKKNQHVVEIKEIRLTSNIDEHDFGFKLKNAQKFLKDGDKVKVTVRFYGRQLAHVDLGENQLKRFADACTDLATVEKAPKLDGRRMSMFLTPKSANKK